MENGNGRGRVRRLLQVEGEPLIRIGWAIGGMLALAKRAAARRCADRH
jgi:hypothetical protein